MTPSFPALSARGIPLGTRAMTPATMTMRMKTFGRKEMTAMCTMVIKRAIFKAECERYRRYAEAKQRIPKNLSPAEYEAAVKKLAKKYRI
jgi:lipase chaperone LimK